MDAFKKTDVHLKMSELDGSAVTEVDLQKLYFVYVSSKPDDWKFILETRGLSSHIPDFAACEPLSGGHFGGVNIPSIDIDRLDESFDIRRSAEEVVERKARAHSIVLPELTEIEGLPMHLTLEQFEKVLDLVLPTWIEFRRHTLLPRQNVKGAAKLAMYADLLSAKAVAAAAEPLLASVQSASETSKVYASLEKGSVSAAAARAFQRIDGTISYIEPNKLPFRVLDVYNGPVLSARIEERPGYIGVADIGSNVRGVIFDQYSQKGILDAIDKCSAYSQLLKLLLTCGFDLGIPDMESNPRRTTGRCWRIMQGSLVLGAVFDYPGKLGCLRWQPSATDFGQQWGMSCIYRDDTSDVFVTCWHLYQTCVSMRNFRQCLLEADIHTSPVTYSANFVV